MAAKKKTTRRKPRSKKTAAKKPKTTKRNRLGVKNSLVNNINARKKKGISRSKKKKTVDKKSYEHMEEGWK
ncbi:hypothetical protein [Chitinophaga sp. S165]|uniref:hypothetical protein n=1 Tax=Chitinophaga sp. S165 TaxID=2135462 RepID=UPI000D70BCAB|nr:hypothetical protein [Chitinophaga sp. S165]PWV45807.1 hypothetical protein C7475_11224 [Chitinophaga sp. S165]